MVQHLLVVRCEPSSPGGLVAVVGVLEEEQVLELVRRVLGVVGDPVEVEAGHHRHLLHLARLLCALVGALGAGARARARGEVTSGLAAGVAAWLEGGRARRGLGIALVTAVLEGLGEQAPEWEVEEEQLLGELRGLCRGGGEEEQVQEQQWEQVLEEWVVEEVIEEVERLAITKRDIKCGEKKVLEEDAKKVTEEDAPEADAPEEEDLDSDDDLEAFDMTEDTVVTEESKVPILYLRDIIHHLSEAESVQVRL